MKPERAHLLLEKMPIKYAKSMPETPHWYTVRDQWIDEVEFEHLVQFIRDNGRRENFFRRVFVYYYFNGFKYWTMGNPLPETTIINKAKA